MNNELLSNNYIFIRNFLEQNHAIDLGKAFEKWCIETNAPQDTQVPNSRIAYGYEPFVRLMLASTYRLSYIAQTPLFPTYNYARVYNKGNVLTPHKDRSACEVSITLCLDENGPAWPIYMTKPNGTVATCILEPGDAVLYLGIRSAHWRNSCPIDNYKQVFMHYVDAQGPHAQEAFEYLKINKK